MLDTVFIPKERIRRSKHYFVYFFLFNLYIPFFSILIRYIYRFLPRIHLNRNVVNRRAPSEARTASLPTKPLPPPPTSLVEIIVNRFEEDSIDSMGHHGSERIQGVAVLNNSNITCCSLQSQFYHSWSVPRVRSALSCNPITYDGASPYSLPK